MDRTYKIGPTVVPQKLFEIAQLQWWIVFFIFNRMS